AIKIANSLLRVFIYSASDNLDVTIFFVPPLTNLRVLQAPPQERRGAVAGLVGIEGGVVSGVINLESSGVEAPDWRPRHDEHTTKLESSQPAAETAVHLFDHWFDPIEAGLRDRVREFIHRGRARHGTVAA